jgi:hypothetical protein
MSNPTAPIAIGDRRMIPVVDLVGPGLVAARVSPHLPPAQLSRLLDAYGDEYADPTRATGKVFRPSRDQRQGGQVPLDDIVDTSITANNRIERMINRAWHRLGRAREASMRLSRTVEHCGRRGYP